MTEKNKRQFLAEVKIFSLQKEFKGLFGEKINPVNATKKVEDILETRRTSYNYGFIKCCEKYHVKNTDSIYSELDKFWEQSKINISLEDMAVPIGSKILYSFLPFPLNLLSNVSNKEIREFQNRINKTWYSYIEKTIIYANSLLIEK
jgi:hypothetical protein